MPASSIKSLITHVKQHSEFKAKYEALVNVPESGSMDNHVMPRAFGPLSAVDKLIIHFIACCDMPFRVIDHPTFRAMFTFFGKIELLRGEKHYRELVLPRVYSYVKVSVQAELSLCVSISFSIDIWSQFQKSFISLTASGITGSWRRVKFLLSMRPFPGSHTAANIRDMVEEMLDDWKIPREKCHAFLHDQGRNITGAFAELADLEDADCGANMIHTVVRNACFPNLDDDRKARDTYTALETTVVKCRAVVGHFKHSPLASERLKQLLAAHGLEDRRPIQDVKTRWNSTHDMGERMLEQKDAIDAYLLEKRRDLLLTADEWTMLEDMVNLLQNFKEMSAHMCLDSSPVSSQIAVRRALVDDLTGTDSGMLALERERLIEFINQKFGGLEQYRTHAVAHFLDPRYKDSIVDDPSGFREVVKHWIASAESLAVPDVAVLRHINDLQDQPAKRARSFISSIGSKYAKQGSTSSQPVRRSDDLEVEMNTYLREPTEDWGADPLVYWKENGPRFPKMAPVAQRFLSAPATSVLTVYHYTFQLLFPPVLI